MQITVIGSGYVGLVAGTCFAEFGFKVTCLDCDVDKIQNLKRGVIPIYEPGLENLIIKNIENDNLQFSSQKEAIDQSEILIIAVGTPSDERGKADLRYLDAVIDDITSHVKQNKFIIIKSTVPIGTAKRISATLNKRLPQIKFDIISNPEFLREGSAVSDFMKPDRVVIGCTSQDAVNLTNKLYQNLTANNVPIVFTDNITAEMIKYTANAYLAMRIAFINEIADIAERVDGSIDDISHAIGLDKRIGSHFLNPSAGYGGSCFPKDILALSTTSKELQADSWIIETVIKSNEQRKFRMVDKLESVIGDLSGKNISIWGLTFKAETDDIRDSASISIIQELIKRKVHVTAYDPKGMDYAKKILPDITYCGSMYECVHNADALIIITEWQQFKNADLKKLSNLMTHKIIIDLRNIFSLNYMKDKGFRYISLGRPAI